SSHQSSSVSTSVEARAAAMPVLGRTPSVQKVERILNKVSANAQKLADEIGGEEGAAWSAMSHKFQDRIHEWAKTAETGSELSNKVLPADAGDFLSEANTGKYSPANVDTMLGFSQDGLEELVKHEDTRPSASALFSSGLDGLSIDRNAGAH